MGTRGYRLGRRQADVDRTRSTILSAARQLVAEFGPDSSVARVADRAGVSRITVYNQFGSKAQLLEALAADLGPGSGAKESGEPGSDPSDDLMRRIGEACAAWSSDPSLHRQLQRRPRLQGEVSDLDRALAERLAAYDRLRPGCSIKEAEDVIGILTSFPVFDRLHKGGRRSPSAVAEILERMASVFMVSRSSV
jgi:AcrR family transcriptional regulator